MRKYSPARISKISGNSAFYLDCSTGASLQTQTQVGLKNRNTSYLNKFMPCSTLHVCIHITSLYTAERELMVGGYSLSLRVMGMYVCCSLSLELRKICSMAELDHTHHNS